MESFNQEPTLKFVQKFNKRQKTLDIESIIKITTENHKITLEEISNLLKNSMYQLELYNRLCKLQEIMSEPLSQNKDYGMKGAAAAVMYKTQSLEKLQRENKKTLRKAPDIPARTSRSKSKSGDSRRSKSREGRLRLPRDTESGKNQVFSAGNSRSQTPEPFSPSRTPCGLGSPTSPMCHSPFCKTTNLDFDLPEGNHNLIINKPDRFRSITPEPNQFQRELTAKLRQNTITIEKTTSQKPISQKLDNNIEPIVIRSEEVAARRAKCRSLEPPSKSPSPKSQDSKKNIRVLTKFMKRRPLPRHDSIKSIVLPRFFGTNLDHQENEHSIHSTEFVSNLITVIENFRPKNGPKASHSVVLNSLAQPGIYRTVGNMKNVQKLRLFIDDNYKNPNRYVRVLMGEGDLNVLTSLLKMFLSELESPLIPTGILNSKKNDSAAKILNSLGGAKQKIMDSLIVHLRKVVRESAENKMDLENLSTCFALNLIDSKAAVNFEEAKVLANNAKLFLMRMIADYNS